jgi:hypothetical protein
LEDFTPDEAITILAKRIGYKSARPPFAKRPMTPKPLLARYREVWLQGN